MDEQSSISYISYKVTLLHVLRVNVLFLEMKDGVDGSGTIVQFSRFYFHFHVEYCSIFEF